MNVLITNAYSSRNKGDAAIIVEMVRDLRSQKEFANAEFCITSSDPETDKDFFACRVVPSFVSITNELTGIPLVNFLLFLTAILPFSFLWLTMKRLLGIDFPLPFGLRGLLRKYASADLIAAAGGGYLYTNSKMRGNVVLLMTLWSFYCAVLLRKPVYLYSQSIGPFSGNLQAALVRRVLGRVRLVQIREAVSLGLVASWALPVAVRLSTDAAFALPAEDPPRGILKTADERRRVGITVRKWFRNTKRQQEFEDVLTEFVCYLTETWKMEIYFVPQVSFAAGNDDDRVCARAICRSLKGNDRIHLIEAKLSPEQTKGLCGQMDYFIGARMHSNIFALSMNVPTLALAYQPKTRGIMQQVGMERYVLPLEGLTLAAMRERFHDLLSDRDAIVARLVERTPELIKQVSLNGKAIAEDYSRWKSENRDDGRRLR